VILALASSSKAGHVKRLAGTTAVDLSMYSPTLSNGKRPYQAHFRYFMLLPLYLLQTNHVEGTSSVSLYAENHACARTC